MKQGPSCRVLACDILCPCHSHGGEGELGCVSMEQQDVVAICCIVQNLQEAQHTLSSPTGLGGFLRPN